MARVLVAPGARTWRCRWAAAALVRRAHARRLPTPPFSLPCTRHPGDPVPLPHPRPRAARFGTGRLSRVVAQAQVVARTAGRRDAVSQAEWSRADAVVQFELASLADLSDVMPVLGILKDSFWQYERPFTRRVLHLLEAGQVPEEEVLPLVRYTLANLPPEKRAWRATREADVTHSMLRFSVEMLCASSVVARGAASDACLALFYLARRRDSDTTRLHFSNVEDKLFVRCFGVLSDPAVLAGLTSKALYDLRLAVGMTRLRHDGVMQGLADLVMEQHRAGASDPEAANRLRDTPFPESQPSKAAVSASFTNVLYLMALVNWRPPTEMADVVCELYEQQAEGAVSGGPTHSAAPLTAKGIVAHPSFQLLRALLFLDDMGRQAGLRAWAQVADFWSRLKQKGDNISRFTVERHLILYAKMWKLVHPTESWAQQARLAHVLRSYNQPFSTTDSRFEEQVRRDVSEWASRHNLTSNDGFVIDKLFVTDISLPELQIAVEANGVFHYCSGSLGEPHGGTAFRTRMLKRMGWIAVEISCYDWPEMEKDPQAVERLVCRAIHQRVMEGREVPATVLDSYMCCPRCHNAELLPTQVCSACGEWPLAVPRLASKAD